MKYKTKFVCFLMVLGGLLAFLGLCVREVYIDYKTCEKDVLWIGEPVTYDEIVHGLPANSVRKKIVLGLREDGVVVWIREEDMK